MTVRVSDIDRTGTGQDLQREGVVAERWGSGRERGLWQREGVVAERGGGGLPPRKYLGPTYFEVAESVADRRMLHQLST